MFKRGRVLGRGNWPFGSDVVMFGLGFEVFLVFFQRKPFCFDEALISPEAEDTRRKGDAGLHRFFR